MLSSIISLYKKVQRNISVSSSGKCKFNLILSFISGCGKTFNTDPPFALIKDFISILLDIILKSDISYTDPSKLNTVKYILNKSRIEYLNSKSGDVIITQIDKAADILNMQLLKSYFYLGKYDDGLIVLKDMLEQRDTFFGEQNEKPRNKTPNKYNAKTAKYALVNPDIYKESKAYEILTEIKNELNRLNSYSDTSINVLLVEHDSKNAGFSGGTIQNLICNTMKGSLSKEEPIEFDNITDFNDLELKETPKEISTAANVLIKHISGKSVPPKTKRTLRFQNVRGIYKGSSLGVGSTIIASCNYFNYINSKRRYKISNAAAFTGVVNKDGKVLKVSGESIKDKVEAAFFSWVKYCVVPKENYNDAISTSEELKKIYPTKELEVIGIETVEEVFNHPEIVQIETLGTFEYTRSAIERNKFKSTAALIVMLVLLTLIFSIKFLPKDIKPLPKTDSEMYLIYAPDREPGWIFKNADYYGGDTINFGDVATGDKWYPLLEFWNNAREKEEFKIFIEGEDKDEFQITYLYKNEQPEAPPVIAPDISQQIYVKFVPTKSERKKSAELVFENNETKLRKSIYLKGEAKRYNNGYCMKIDENDDVIVLEPNTNLVRANTSISLWIKPYWFDSTFLGSILTIENNPLSNNKLKLYTYNGNKLGLGIWGNKSTELSASWFETGRFLKMNEWNFIAISIRDSTVSLVLNDADTTLYFPKMSLRIMNDYIYMGTVRPDEKQKYDAQKIYLKYYIDEFKIFDRAVSPQEFIKNRFDKEFGKEYMLAGYNFEDATPKRVYDESAYDFWPRLHGGIKRTIDTTQPFVTLYANHYPLSAISPDHRTPNDISDNTVFSSTRGFAILNKDLYGTKSSFTLIADLKGKEFEKVSNGSIFLRPYFFNRPDLDIEFKVLVDSVCIRIINFYRGEFLEEYYKIEDPLKWKRFSITYDLDNSNMFFYINNKLIRKFENIYLQDISQNYMGISFGMVNYYGSPRFFQRVAYELDNIKIYSRALKSDELFSDSKNGLITEWDFENTDKELAYDNVSGLPLLMIEPFELKTEDVEFIR